MTVSAPVTATRVATAEVVPGSGLVASVGAVPDRVADEDGPAAPRDAHHLLGHHPGVGHVLEHVARVAEVQRTLPERELHATADHRAGVQLAQARELTDV